MERTALYPGSFDPFTNGHLGITERGLKAFDKVVIGIATNSRKEPMFSVQERIAMIRHIFEGETRVQVCSFEGLTVNYAEAIKATVILRGLRAVADFEYEFQMANMNRKLNSSVETLFMMTEAPYFFVSSQNVKEVARFGGDISGIVPPYIGKMVREKLK
ncbi:MAG: pantetheine-phosphate adenylyltransferase [Proteobacteria bacterium]|nr:pantetheine-phosphate adenylyltransferase [Pseudomonadota bacterium]